MTVLISETAQATAKIIFESLRNSLVCAAIAVAGIATVFNPKLSPIGVDLAPWLGYSIIVLSAFLFLWNFLLTVVSIYKNPNVWTFSFWLISAPAVALSLLIMLSVYGAAVSLQGQRFQPTETTHQAQPKP